VFWFAMLVVGGYAVYVLRPDERKRVLAAAARFAGTAADTVRRRAPRAARRPDPFGEALAARTRVPYVSLAILLLNTAVFALMVVGPSPLDDRATLVRWGGSLGPLTTNGEWWRLVTAAFVHAGVVHFVVDVVALAQAAVLVERIFGHVTLAGIYLTSAALATTIGLSGEPLAVTTGAAAPIFALYGLLVALVVRGTLQRSPLTVPLYVLRRLAPAAAVFVLYYMWANGAQWTAGLATFVIGFATGLALTRNVAERKPTARRVLSLAATTATMAITIVTPLKGMTDARAHVARVFAVEEHTMSRYRAATEQFTRGTIKAQVLAQFIERSVVPELQSARRQLKAVAGVPRQQQPLIADADLYLRLRVESWVVRANALQKSNMRLLRNADEIERASLAALEKIRPAVTETTGG
jgi:rhomboid protease GluP